MKNGKYNKEIVEEICKLVRHGVFNKDAAIAVGISESTFYSWQNKDGPLSEEQRAEFLELLKRAEANRKKNFVLAISRAASKTWQAAAWYLERVYNTEFARREIRENKNEDVSDELLEKMQEAFDDNDKKPSK